VASRGRNAKLCYLVNATGHIEALISMVLTETKKVMIVVIRRSKVMVEWPIGYDEYKSSQVVGST
jgi:hypothetical protein